MRGQSWDRLTCGSIVVLFGFSLGVEAGVAYPEGLGGLRRQVDLPAGTGTANDGATFATVVLKEIY